jgi:hypothetical protein
MNIFSFSMNRKALFLICSESIAVLKEYNTASHYNLKHKEKYKNCVRVRRQEKVVALSRLESQQNVFRKQSNGSYLTMGASYVAHLLPKESKPFSNEEFIRKCLQHRVQEIVWKNKLILQVCLMQL